MKIWLHSDTITDLQRENSIFQIYCFVLLIKVLRREAINSIHSPEQESVRGTKDRCI